MVLFHVKATEKKFSELTESAAVGFSMVYVMLQAVYTTAEKEIRAIVFLFFLCLMLTQKAPIRHKRWNNMILHPVPVKQYSYENDFSGVFDALNQSFQLLSVDFTDARSCHAFITAMSFLYRDEKSGENNGIIV